MHRIMRLLTTGLFATLLSACASTGDIVASPGVSLRNIEAVDVGFSGQTFALGFDVTNPNPFPLPIKSVAYSVELDGHRFATGQTPGEFVIPASGDGEFAISVEIDLLKTAPQLLYILKDLDKRPIAYELKGEFGLGIPMADPVSFRTGGYVRLREISHQARTSR